MDGPCARPEPRTDRDTGALITRQQHAREDAGVVALPAMFARMYQPANTVRRECLEPILLVSEAHSRRVLDEYARYFNHARPHQGIQQRVPEPGENEDASMGTAAEVTAFPVRGRPHHAYRRAA